LKITRFEDIQAWQVARELCKGTYALSNNGQFAKDLALRDQVRRAAVSIMANISEGFDSRSNAEFIQFLYYALRSASELQSHLYVALDQGYISQDSFAKACEEAGKVKSMTFAFVQYLRNHKKPNTTKSCHPEPRTLNPEPRTPNLER